MTQMERRQALAATVRDAMRDAGVSDSALARVTGIPRPTLRRKIAGERDFAFIELAQVAVALDIPSDSLFAVAVPAGSAA